jgi:hypothetical protein
MTELPRNPRGFQTASVWFPLLREIALFVAGIGLLIVETTHPDPRTPVLLIALALAGFPVLNVLDRVITGK